MRSKQALIAAAAVAFAGTGMLATAGTATASAAASAAHPASAASVTSTTSGDAAPQAVYNGKCGPGYSVVNSAGIANLGTVFLTYNHSTGKNCVVTVRNKKGSAVPMSATVRVIIPGRHTDPVVDKGNYTLYAGPVSVGAKGRCVEWGGSIQNQHYLNPGSNCGARTE